MTTRNLHMIRRLQLVTLAVLVGLVPPLVIGAVLLQRSARADERERLDRQLAAQRDLQVNRLEAYFIEASRLNLSAAYDTAFSVAYPGGRSTPVGTARARRRGAEGVLGFLMTLYPTSIGEACLIDRRGPEIARVVEGELAPAGDLSASEATATFFRPTFAASRGRSTRRGRTSRRTPASGSSRTRRRCSAPALRGSCTSRSPSSPSAGAPPRTSAS